MKRLLLVLLLGGCATAPPASPALTVSEVWARHHELDGTMIRVRGVVTRCYRLGCQLYPSAGDRSKWVSIGTSQSFDELVQLHIGKHIIVSGRLKADCLHVYADQDEGEKEGSVVICSDRASMLLDPELISRVR